MTDRRCRGISPSSSGPIPSRSMWFWPRQTDGWKRRVVTSSGGGAEGAVLRIGPRGVGCMSAPLVELKADGKLALSTLPPGASGCVGVRDGVCATAPGDRRDGGIRRTSSAFRAPSSQVYWSAPTARRSLSAPLRLSGTTRRADGYAFDYDAASARTDGEGRFRFVVGDEDDTLGLLGSAWWLMPNGNDGTIRVSARDGDRELRLVAKSASDGRGLPLVLRVSGPDGPWTGEANLFFARDDGTRTFARARHPPNPGCSGTRSQAAMQVRSWAPRFRCPASSPRAFRRSRLSRRACPTADRREARPRRRRSSPDSGRGRQTRRVTVDRGQLPATADRRRRRGGRVGLPCQAIRSPAT